MRYVALLSGGKDSCFNLLHCAQNGHELVAAASLGPGADKGETDSYMYQTVGQDAIKLVAEALEVPLFRRVIQGQAINQNVEYGSRLSLYTEILEGDETEDLFALLSEVKSTFPDIQGVSVGAILSNYQRVRVEHVCQRLSLIPLSYLWQRDQAELLNEMIQSGLKAILIKVAGIGLATRHLGKSLEEMQSNLLDLHARYGAHVCGEGGEYESLTLDSPLFKRKIVLEDVETVIHSDNDFATVAYLRIKKARLESKSLDHSTSLFIPPLLSREDEEVEINVLKSQKNALPSASRDFTSSQHLAVKSTLPTAEKIGAWVVISDVAAPITNGTLTIEEEVKYCFEAIKDRLSVYGLNLSHIANITLLLSSMEHFPAINEVYASFFGSSPPARACVAVDLPEEINIRMECIAHDTRPPRSRQCLHVQSLSYWAPANIGPYSQAISVGGRIFISGQIGLVPASNNLPSPSSLAKELALSLRHVQSISQVVQSTFTSCKQGVMQGVISWLTSQSDLISVQRGMASSSMSPKGNVPTLFVVVKSLPKGALVETQIFSHAMDLNLSDDEENFPVIPTVQFLSGAFHGLSAHWEMSYVRNLEVFVVIVCCTNGDDIVSLGKQLASTPVLCGLWASAALVRVLHTPSAAPDISRLFNQLFYQQALNQPPVTTIPSRMIATWDKCNWDYALFFMG